MKHSNCCGGHPRGGAGLYSEVILDFNEEVSKVFENSSSKAHGEEG